MLVFALQHRRFIIVLIAGRGLGGSLVWLTVQARAGLRVLLQAGHNGVEPRFDVVKLRGAEQVLIARRELLDLLLSLDYALRRRRMVRKNLVDATRLPPLFLQHFAKECRVGVRVVASLVHVLQAQIVCFGLVITSELEKGDRNSEVERLGHTDINRVTHRNEDERYSRVL